MAGYPYHEPVLLREVVDCLITDPSGVYVDGTVGGGGHAEAICKRLTGGGVLVCCDADRDAIECAEERLRGFRERLSFVQANFSELEARLTSLIPGSVSGILLDLGVSSHQLDEPARGFSFRASAPLDMRFGTGGQSAHDVVNGYGADDLERVLRDYGEERAARRIARAIVARRPLDSTGELVHAVESAVGPRYLIKSLARVFQAVRIEVNRELDHLARGLPACVRMLRAGGRLVVISYHSLEDRTVKDFFARESARWIRSGQKLVPDTPSSPTLRVLTRHPVVPSREEVSANPRSRSAKMRVAERCVAE